LLNQAQAILAIDLLPTVFPLIHDVLMGVKIFTTAATFKLSQGVASVGIRFHDLERCAFTFRANVFHELFKEAKVINLIVVKFPNSPFV